MSSTLPPTNIGPRERRRRRVFGAWTLLLATITALVLWALGLSAPVRLVLAPAFLGGFLGVIQAREST
jgi:hypothetical protein